MQSHDAGSCFTNTHTQCTHLCRRRCQATKPKNEHMYDLGKKDTLLCDDDNNEKKDKLSEIAIEQDVYKGKKKGIKN